MFDIGWGELVVIGIVALIVIGPKELPTVLRTLGQWIGKVRRMASDFQGQFQEAMREAEMDDLKKQFDEVSNTASDLTHGIENPLETVRKDVEAALEDKPVSHQPGAEAEQNPETATASATEPNGTVPAFDSQSLEAGISVTAEAPIKSESIPDASRRTKSGSV